MSTSRHTVYSWKYNSPGIFLKAGQSVSVIADPHDRWKDLNIECDADGWWSYNPLYNLNFIKKSMDFPYENFMKLCARVGNEKFVIGKFSNFTPKTSGYLELFANDVSWLRWNNTGSITVTIAKE